MTRIYTRSGDNGTTSLGNGRRVEKDGQCLQAGGTIDELNSLLGVALTHDLDDHLKNMLKQIQHDLFCLGADLSCPRANSKPRLQSQHVEQIEKWIDELAGAVGPLRCFILPGGAAGAACLHLARAVCRRAEREVVALSRQEALNPAIVSYLNRLGDALFVMARFENMRAGVSETAWTTDD